jgi:peptidoglycan/xylan/chitin deacetylase (PgdA/CDA1 family)
MYHRVIESPRDPFRICVRPESFDVHLGCIKRHADIVPLSALMERSGDARVAITFDDGYVDNLIEVQPILESAQAFATFSVVAVPIGDPGEFWWDRLEQLILGSSEDRVALDVDVTSRTTVRLRFDNAVIRQQALWTLHSLLLALPPEEVDRVIASIGSRLGIGVVDRPSHRCLTLDELVTLASFPLVEIGAHSLSHPALPSLPVDAQREEIERSRSVLQSTLDAPVQSFAYPFGEYDATTARLVQEAGFGRACTVEPGVVVPITDPFRIPRHEVLDWDEDEFEAALTRWLEVT